MIPLSYFLNILTFAFFFQEHHLQQAIFHHRVIPVPEVYESDQYDDKVSFDQLYPPNFKVRMIFCL